MIEYLNEQNSEKSVSHLSQAVAWQNSIYCKKQNY